MPETQFILYQTLEDQGNYLDNEQEGPYDCKWDNTWLGKGYYYWYHHIDVAKWWGVQRYGVGKYVVFKSICTDLSKCWDLHTGPDQEIFLYWLMKMKDKGLLENDTTVAQVIEFIKGEYDDFNYEGIRILGIDSISQTAVRNMNFQRLKFEIPNFQRDASKQRFKAYFDLTPPVQVCLFKHGSLGRKDYKVVFPDEYCEDYNVEDFLI